LYYNQNNVQLKAAQDNRDNPLSLVILDTPHGAERLAVSRNDYLELVVKSITYKSVDKRDAKDSQLEDSASATIVSIHSIGNVNRYVRTGTRYTYTAVYIPINIGSIP
jgi:hypothetical protein